MKCIYRNDWNGVGDLMLSSAEKLAKIGADFLICPDNTIHQAMPYVAERSPLPWLHIAHVVAEATRIRLVRGSADYRAALAGELHRRYAVLASELVLAGAGD